MAGTFERMRQWVQDTKIEESRVRITKFQYGEKWPDEYNSWVMSETPRNLYKDPDKFFASMHRNADRFWKSKFIFKPLGGNDGAAIKEATEVALRTIRRQFQKYFQAPNVSGSPNIKTGRYMRQLNLLLNKKLVTSVRQLDGLTNQDVVAITNIAEYATATERNALYHAKVGGILFFAAKKIKILYPQLSIRFTYIQSSNPMFASIGSYFSTAPVIQIGTHDTVSPKIQRPRQDTYNAKSGRRRFGYKYDPSTGYSR
jgi:hypothetical protein